jgi:PPOX class probable FMN-dependent enzyme
MDFITTNEQLRSIYKAPGATAVRKELRRLDGHCRNFIARSPFVLIGSSDRDGNADVTPKGDRPGFAVVIDDATLAIPDRPGNNRLDTLENILVNPAVGLLFLIPGMNETLRVNGLARLTADAELCERLAVDGKKPQCAIVVSVRAAYLHCAKAFLRSGLWEPATWMERSTLPTLGQMLKDQLELPESAEKTDEWLATAYRQSMW